MTVAWGTYYVATLSSWRGNCLFFIRVADQINFLFGQVVPAPYPYPPPYAHTQVQPHTNKHTITHTHAKGSQGNRPLQNIKMRHKNLIP